MKHFLKLVIFIPSLICSSALLSEEQIVIKKDVIKGNSELPKVMYIIPWQSTVTESSFQGVQLDNYFESLLKPFHPHKVHIK